MLLSHNLLSNNLTISNASLSGKDTVVNIIQVKFDISWENSWRLNEDIRNWDAVWVFVKFRKGTGIWQHASLSTKSSFHFAPNGCKIDAVSDGKGVFVYKATAGIGSNNWAGIELQWNYGLDGLGDSDDVSIQVLGIEMVYVPEGEYYLGDGLGSNAHIWNAANYPAYNPALINNQSVVIRCNQVEDIEDEPGVDISFYDDEQIINSGILVNGALGIDMDGNEAIDNPDFPTGYKAFYCMKYEISNQQYAQFLNTLTRNQQNTRTVINISNDFTNKPFVMNGWYGSSNPLFRNCIRAVNEAGGTIEPVRFYCDLNQNEITDEADDGQDIAFSFSGWPDVAAYADWSGLRPMTELEYEKACRGPELPLVNEYAWHTTKLYGNEYIVLNQGNSAEYPENPGISTSGNATYIATTGHATVIESPLRCGIFATSNTNRVLSGGSYYGIFELSGNLSERTVSIGRLEGRKFKGTHGDGNLTSLSSYEGNATNADWPGILAGYEDRGVIGENGTGSRGGDWNDPSTFLRVSDRMYAAHTPYKRNPGPGIRCVRSVQK